MTATALRAHRPRPVGILAAALLLAAGSVLAGWSGLGDPAASSGSGDAASLPSRAPGEATSPTVPLPIPGGGTATLPAGSLAQLDHNIAAWTLNLVANPHDFVSATNLATLYQGRARLTADLGDHERALEAARTAIAIAPSQPAARILEATVLLSLHDFRAARDAAEALYRDDPAQLAALATRADAELELGELDAAAADLAILGRSVQGAGLDIRRARLTALRGDLAGALALAEAARDAAAADGSETGFYAYAVGEYARQAGDAATARDSYEQALAARATDLGALLGFARIQAFEGDVDAAIATLTTATAIAPTPEAEALLGDLLAVRAADPARAAPDRAADRRAAETAHGTVRLTRTLSALAGSVYDRTLVLFELDHGGASGATLASAREALAARSDGAGHDVLAWALHRLGRDAEAWTESQAARASGAADARTLFHGGAIAAALGADTRAARDLLARALALGPALDPGERAEAAAILATLEPMSGAAGGASR